MAKIRFKKICVLLCLPVLALQCTVARQLMRPESAFIANENDFAPYEGVKRKIAVPDFKDDTEFGKGQAGSALSYMITSAVQKSSRFCLVEKSYIDELLGEHALQQGGFSSDNSLFNQLSQSQGTHAVLLGEITELDYKYSKKDVESEEKDWGFSLMASMGRISVNYELINPQTGEILLSDFVTKTEIRPGFSLRTKEFDFNDIHSLDQSVLGLAMRAAAFDIAKALADYSSEIEWRGKVIKVVGTKLFFTPGFTEGIKKGDFFLSRPRECEVNCEYCKIRVVDFLNDRVSIAEKLAEASIQPGDFILLPEDGVDIMENKIK